MLREVDGAHTSHPTAAHAAGSLTSTGTRCQSSYQVCAQPIAALPVWVVMVVLAGGGGGGCWPLLRGTLSCPARPLTPALWSDSPETSASLIGSQSRVNQRSVSAGSISRNRCSSHHFRPPGMEPPAQAATCVCCLSFPCAAAIALLLTSAPLHAGHCCTRCWNPALVARQMPSHHRQRRKARHKASVQTGPQSCAQMLARQVGDSTQRRFASPPNHSRGPRAGSAGGAHIGRPRTLHVCHSTVAESSMCVSLHWGHC